VTDKVTSSLEELKQIFNELGAEDPEGWALSQINEGIPQLHRFLFLKKAWSLVMEEQDDSWIDRSIKSWRDHPNAPFSGQGRALDHMLTSGVERSAIVDIVRAAQVEMIHGICYQMSDPSLSGDEQKLLGDIGWALVTTNDDYEPTSEVIDGLHESILELDPTGREMRPRPTSSQ